MIDPWSLSLEDLDDEDEPEFEESDPVIWRKIEKLVDAWRTLLAEEEF